MPKFTEVVHNGVRVCKGTTSSPTLCHPPHVEISPRSPSCQFGGTTSGLKGNPSPTPMVDFGNITSAHNELVFRVSRSPSIPEIQMDALVGDKEDFLPQNALIYRFTKAYLVDKDLPQDPPPFSEKDMDLPQGPPVPESSSHKSPGDNPSTNLPLFNFSLLSNALTTTYASTRENYASAPTVFSPKRRASSFTSHSEESQYVSHNSPPQSEQEWTKVKRKKHSRH
ncbi:hypothetical protein SUGI_0590670 [Cryptomeria japonica]|nr:hypothetical protein SUGI_0590670 [Cryptomeria japonica]